LGQKCDKCHNNIEWKEKKFDHDKDTKFKITGAHQKAVCDDCHKKNPYEEKLETNCYSCHKKDDEHEGKNGRKCEACHLTDSWTKSTFDHDKTNFKLRNRHAKLVCEACHKKNVYDEKIETQCFSCHRKDDVHKKQEGEMCQSCHNDQGWKVKVSFSHELTRFPLSGLHGIVPCNECHLTESFQDSEMDCMSCHQNEDVHKKSLGTNCSRCHTPNGWKIWEFDHNKETKYRLDGAHEKLACSGCHQEPADEKNKVFLLPRNCFGCHQKDDIHKGGFGLNCERCHVTSSFRDFKSRFRTISDPEAK
jgi:hypothetical protein